ncbi:MAG: DNA-binding protein [Deltaproteobacteria bacterium]|nr:MAG: DNA-binding protein [Deltaproteobacteria bacterium]
MKPTVYIETSIVSYLTAKLSSDLRAAACQSITTEWWERQRKNFELYISEFVIVEASRGDKNAAKLRLAALKELTQLKVTEDAKILANKFITEGALPAKAKIDAFHVAVAVTSGIEYLLTWNCTHIANATMYPKINKTCRLYGFEPTIICTPSELIEVKNVE